MNYQIILRNNREMEVGLSEEEYQWLKNGLMNGKLRVVELAGELINVNQILEVKPIAAPIPKEFRLPEVGRGTAENNNDKPVRVPGGFQKPSLRNRMIELFNRLKANGCFTNYDSYEAWEKASYKE